MRWYLLYKLSFRDLVGMMAERGLQLAHTTVIGWVQRCVPEFEKRSTRYMRQSGRLWRADETRLKVRGRWVYLYRAVDRDGGRHVECGGAWLRPVPILRGDRHQRDRCEHRRRGIPDQGVMFFYAAATGAGSGNHGDLLRPPAPISGRRLCVEEHYPLGARTTPRSGPDVAERRPHEDN